MVINFLSADKIVSNNSVRIQIANRCFYCDAITFAQLTACYALESREGYNPKITWHFSKAVRQIQCNFFPHVLFDVSRFNFFPPCHFKMDHLHKSQILNLAIAYKLPSITQLDRVQTFIPFNFLFIFFFATVATYKIFRFVSKQQRFNCNCVYLSVVSFIALIFFIQTLHWFKWLLCVCWAFPRCFFFLIFNLSRPFHKLIL